MIKTSRTMIATLAFATCLVSASASQAGLGVAGQAREQALETEWSRELNSQPKQVAYQSPIQRVISLLEKMKAELVAEADKEAEMYDQMVCWCETNEKEKKKAIADAEALDKELSAEIQSRAAKFGEDATEIERLKAQIAEDTASLKEATSIREAEAAKFYESNKDLIQSVTNVKNAIQILGKHNSAGASFVQLDASVLASVRSVLSDLAFKVQLLEAGKPDRKAQKGAFLQTETTGDSLLNIF